MKRLHSLIYVLGAAALAMLGTASCGDNGVECGDLTHAVGGQCVPDSTCGPGTMLAGTTCVPDGSVVCVQGTVFDPGLGTCVLDPNACADGTTLVIHSNPDSRECVPDDELLEEAADHHEGAEPNGPDDDNVAGMFPAPALDSSTTLYGCITATVDSDGDGNLDSDLDTWLVTANAPMVLEVTADGIHGLSAGFVAINFDPMLQPTLDNWQRIGLNLTGDTSKREIFLPAAGTYALLMTDTRSLFLGAAGAGTEDTCYFATVKHVANPTPTPITIPTTTGMDRGQVRFMTYTANGTGDIIDVAENTVDAPALQPAFVTLRGNALQGSSASTAGLFGDIPPFNTVGGLNTGDTVTFVVDSEYNFGEIPQQYRFDFLDINAQPLPTTGSVATVTEEGDTGVFYTGYSYLYFDVAVPGVKHFALTASKSVDMAIVRRDIFPPASGALDYVAEIDVLDEIGDPDATGRTAFNGELVRFLQPGRYYFVVQNPAATDPGGTFTITSTVTDVPTTPVTLGTAVTAQPLVAGNALHTIDLTDPIWLEFGITATTNWGTGNVSLEAYDVAAGGWLRSGAPSAGLIGSTFPVFSGTQPAVAPFAPLARIMPRETRDFLLRIKPTTAPGTGPTYSFLPRNRPNVTNLNVIPPGTPVVRTVPGLAQVAPQRFIAFGTPGHTLRALAHPTGTNVDIRERRFTASEAVAATFNATGVGGDETLVAAVGAQPTDWVAWSVENTTTAVTSDVTLTVSTVAPRPYVVTTGTLAFADACTGGGTVLGVAGVLDDEVFDETLPGSFTAFQLFGEATTTTFQVGTNGWIAFDPRQIEFNDPSLGAFANAPIPTAGVPDGVIAPMWQDTEGTTLCRKAAGNTVTYQWSGHVWGIPTLLVQFQAVLHSDGVIDFIYGPMHQSNGLIPDTDDNGATVGVENLTGTVGQQLVFNQALIMANTSRTLTPM